jgi:uncharacterized hydantoinase/oxoprolinase family protein
VNPHSALLCASLVALGSDLLKVDHEHLGIVLGVREELGRVESEDVVCDGLGGLGQEVAESQQCSTDCIRADLRIVNAEVVVEPVDLSSDQLDREEARSGEDPSDIGLLVRLEREGR